MYGQPAQNAPAVFSACQVQFFSSLLDAFFAVCYMNCFRVNGSMEELVSLLRVLRRKKDL